MKYGVVSYANSINMGDEVQSIAAMRLLPEVNYFVERNQINRKISEEKIKLICNGWFTDKPSAWPPSENIIPLFISFHITRSNKSKIVIPNRKLRDYYMQHGPIGCRDLGTLSMLKKSGIDAYYSGDLTLTLRNQFQERNEDILLVDPLRHNYSKAYRDFIIGQLVPKKYQDSIKIIKQRRDRIDISLKQRFQDAENLIEQYSKAKLVITSRIHCALPCLALGTPVYFVNAGYHSTLLNLNDRFEGVIEMFRTFGEDGFPFAGKSLKDKGFRLLKLYENNSVKPLNIDWENPEPNNFDFKAIKESLLARVNGFIE